MARKSLASPAMPQMDAQSKKREREYEDERDHRTLSDAEDIRSDRERMKGVQRHQKKQERILGRVGRSIGKRSARMSR